MHLTVEAGAATDCFNKFILLMISTYYSDVIMGAIASQITRLTIVYSTVYLDTDQRKHQSSVSLTFVRGIHRWPVNHPHKWPVTRKMFPFDDLSMTACSVIWTLWLGGVENASELAYRRFWWCLEAYSISGHLLKLILTQRPLNYCWRYRHGYLIHHWLLYGDRCAHVS